MECDITFEKPVLEDTEEIARLLSSPVFYDANTHQLNFAAFNLRRFANGEVESYVSLSRMSFIDQKHLNKKGKYVFKKTESHYVGYALFTPKYLANLHDRLRIYPVKPGFNDHCGMFFTKPYVIPFDECGLPIQVSTKIEKYISNESIDSAMASLKKLNVDEIALSTFEKSMVKYVQANL